MTAHTHTHTACAMCNGESNEVLVARYAQMIVEHGFGVVGVVSETEPCWGYTVGLQATFEHPELVLYGLSPDTMLSLFWEATEKIKAGATLEPGTLVSEIIRDFDIAIVEVEEPLDPNYPLSMATNFSHAEDIKAVQLVWPDKDGHYPWEAASGQAVFGTFGSPA